MTNQPDDQIDASEARFARRVRDYTEPAVVPVDHAAIASAASGASRAGAAGVGRGSRLAWLAGAAAILVVAAGGVIALGGLRGPGVGAVATPTSQPSAGAGTCSGSDVDAQIVRWEGAAGSRIATVTLTSTATSTCQLEDYTLALVDGAGRGRALIQGTDVQPGITLQPGQQATTLIQVSNYCLAPVPVEPVSIRLHGTSGDIDFQAAADGSSGVPPCSGAGVPGSIAQQPWKLAAG